MKVSSDSLKILGKELPWVLALIPKGVEEFQVQLMDLNILGLKPEGCEGLEGDWWLREDIYLVDEAGNVIGKVGIKEKLVPKKRFVWRRFSFVSFLKHETISFMETVEEAISRIGEVAWTTRYIVVTRRFGSGTFYIYKLPNRVPNLRMWLDHKATEASQELNTVLNG